MARQSGPWTAEFYRDARGRSPVLEFLDRLSENDQAKIASDIRLLEVKGVDEPVPRARPLAGHTPLWELRPDRYRIIYFAHTGRRFVILHAFAKKSRKTRSKDIAIAERRFAEFVARKGG